MTHFFASPLFQSTRPVRGATASNVFHFCIAPFQSTRPVRGATKLQDLQSENQGLFQSTRPVRGATHDLGQLGQQQ